MSDISNQLIKDSYNYILQSDLSTGIIYRIGGDIPVNPIFSSGLTITDGLTADTISATTYYNLPATPFLPLSGGTISGATNFTDGLTADTISATTYYNLPKDIFVTGGTYSSGNAIFTNNSGGTFNVTGFPIGGGGGQIFYLNLSQSQNGNRLLSTTASTSSEQSTGVTINSNSTNTISSFQSQPLNTTILPGGIWSFYLHSYKENTNASFNIFVELYKITSGGTQTLLFTTDPTPVTTNSPNPSMQLTDGYFSGTSLSVSDGVVAVVKATNTSNQSHTITFFTEGSFHYSYVVSTIPIQQGLTCDILSGCSIIQTIQTNVSNKLDKSGGTITGDLVINSGLTVNTISSTTFKLTGDTATPLLIERISNRNSNIQYKNTGGSFFAGITQYNSFAIGSSNNDLGTNAQFSVFPQTGNVVIQNGGSPTDAGYRLDVSGSTRLNGNVNISSGLTSTTISATTVNITDSLTINNVNITSTIVAMSIALS